jgi:hypothetical protein
MMFLDALPATSPTTVLAVAGALFLGFAIPYFMWDEE